MCPQANTAGIHKGCLKMSWVISKVSGEQTSAALPPGATSEEESFVGAGPGAGP